MRIFSRSPLHVRQINAPRGFQHGKQGFPRLACQFRFTLALTSNFRRVIPPNPCADFLPKQRMHSRNREGACIAVIAAVQHNSLE